MRRSPVLVWTAPIALLAVLLVGCSGTPSVTLPPTTIMFHDTGGLWSTEPDGRNLIQITDSGWFAEYAPDNSKIAFSRPHEDGVWIANADGTSPARLTDSGSAPSWSPDGSKFAFNAMSGTETKSHVWIMNADGTEAQQLTRTNGSFPHWSPLGDTIAFHGEVNNGIWLISPDGSDERMLYRWGGYPAWSPDGTEIAYVDLIDWCIWLMNAGGSEHRKLTDHKGIAPTWSPDGSQIAYAGLQRGNEGIWVVNADGSDDHRIGPPERTAQPTPVGRIPLKPNHPDWSN